MRMGESLLFYLLKYLNTFNSLFNKEFKIVNINYCNFLNLFKKMSY